MAIEEFFDMFSTGNKTHKKKFFLDFWKSFGSVDSHFYDFK